MMALTVKKGWEMPRTCENHRLKPHAMLTRNQGRGEWDLYLWCDTCDGHGGDIEWPFVEKGAVADDLKALGFRIDDEDV